MKTLLSILAFLPSIVFSQIVQINLETLDKVEKQFKRWGGDEEKIIISLVNQTNVTKNESKKYVSVEISSKDVETEFTNIGLALIGSYSAVNVNASLKTQDYKGSIQIDKKHETKIVDFLNQTIHKNANLGDNEFSMNLNIDQRLTISFVYANKRSKYFLQIDDAWFSISYDEGIAMLREFIVFLRKID